MLAISALTTSLRTHMAIKPRANIADQSNALHSLGTSREILAIFVPQNLAGAGQHRGGKPVVSTCKMFPYVPGCHTANSHVQLH